MARSKLRRGSSRSATVINYDDPDSFVVNASYLRAHALEAVISFFSPLFGIYAAAAGRKSVLGRETAGKN